MHKMPSPEHQTVLVTGANGYIGNAVARAFIRAGWMTYGLIRNAQAQTLLAADEIIPVVGSAADLSFLDNLYGRTKTFNVIVSTTEQILDYIPHYNDTVALLRTLSETSNSAGVRPLVLFTSGCKDYGTTGLAGSENLSPHTETSAMNPPPFAINRASHAIKLFDHSDLFDAVVLRPTTVYGLSGSFYSPLFDVAAQAAEKGVLELTADPDTILHGTHVDDCAEAYVAIAECGDRDVVKGQCYNISGHRYETLAEVANALVKEYGIRGGVKYFPKEGGEGGFDVVQAMIGFSQWVGSEKLRKDVGWSDRRALFSEGLTAYRGAYEAAVAQGREGVKRIQMFVNMAKDRKGK